MHRTLFRCTQLLILATLCGCEQTAGQPATPTSPAESDIVTPNAGAHYPVLAYRREQGDEVLLHHTLTAEEQKLFHEMDAAVVDADNDEIDADYELVSEIGSRHGLSRNESIAFWVRTTFSAFEPAEFDPAR